MKKVVALLCMITCIMGLTACSGKSEIDEYQQQKLDVAVESVAPGMVSFLGSFIDDATYESYKDYTNEELEYIFETSYGILVDGYGLKTAMESFHLSGETTGAVIGMVSADAVADGSQIIIYADVDCEKKDAQVEIIISNDLFRRLEGAALNPVATKGDMIGKAGLNTLLGMGTVFMVLILISLIIACFGIIPKIQKAFEKKKEEKPAAVVENVAVAGKQEEAVVEDVSDDTELVAVIAAAIAAYEGSASVEGFQVRSIRRLR